MAVDYPANLRAPLNTVVKTQTATFRNSEPLSGPAYTEKLSTDAPVFYQLTFKFRYKSESLLFRSWVEANDIHRGAPFNCPIRTDASGDNLAATTQLVKVVGGDIRSSSCELNIGFFTYTANVQCRKEVTGLENYYDIIAEGGSFLLEGRESLDISINQLAPEA